ncbi:MAG: hypothetical protein WCP95_09265 [Actinomycetes bacterium]
MTENRSAGRRRHRLHRTAVAVAALGVLALTSVTAASGASSMPMALAPAAITPAAAPAVAVDPSSSLGGMLVLTTGPGAVGTVTYKKTGVPDVTQSLAATSCAMTTTPTLLGFKAFVNGIPSTVGLRNGSIGVKDGTSTAVACGRVSTTSTNTESLQIDLNVGRPSGTVKPVATSAFLDLEVKGNARIQAVTSLNGVPNGVYELQAGTSIGSAPTAFSALSSSDTHVANPNCGALIDPLDDDGYRDNCRFAISTPSWLGSDDGNVFDSITLKAISGSFSLEGGADGSVVPLPPATLPQRGSIFELSESVLSCGDTTTLPVDGTLPGAVITRLNNSVDPATCNAVPFTLTHTARTITFLKPVSQQQTAQFTIKATWPELNRGDSPGDVPVTNYEFTPGLFAPRAITWCSAPIFDGAGNLTGISNLAAQPDLEPDTTVGAMPGKQYTCLASSSATMAGDGSGTLTVVQQIFLAGDIRYTH